MTFWHEGVKVTHPKLYAAFLRGVRYLEEEGVFVVQLGHFRGQIDVEDNAWWVVTYDGDTGAIDLTDGSQEPLQAATLRADSEQVLCCSVKGRFPARFTHAGQAMLLNELDLESDPIRLRAGSSWLDLPEGLLPA